MSTTPDQEKHGFDFNRHRSELRYEPSFTFINWKLKKELGLIDRKYRYVNDPELRWKETNEVIEYAKKLKKHIVDNRIEIPEDPDKQSEIQKLIVNAPPFPQGFDYNKYYAKTLVRDRETGMYWSLKTGLPSVGPEWAEDIPEFLDDTQSTVQYDYSVGWFYNFLRRLFSGYYGD